VAARHPTKYNLDEKELERISAVARIELEDARVELERASEAAKAMNREGGNDEDGDADADEDDGWEE
jgi:periodic tryptophan protein 1